MEDLNTPFSGFTVTDRARARGAVVAGRPNELAYNHINPMSFCVASV